MIRYIFFVFYFIAGINGQTIDQRKKLLDLSEAYLKKSQSQKAQADSTARLKNWPIYGKLSTGEEFWLKRLAF